nr:hypothetical protein [Cohnella silvisoli]
MKPSAKFVKFYSGDGVYTDNAYKSVKWLNRIELIEKDHIGYWEQGGYDTDAWIRA